MRKFDQGSLVRVSVNYREVQAFAEHWPCSGLPTNTNISFTFDKKNGNVLDMMPSDIEGEALNALMADAQKYAGVR